MSRSTPLRVAILGAGPIGLEAAIYAKSAGLSATVYEAANVATHVERWGFLKMFTPFGMNVTALGKQAIHRDTPTKEFPADTDLLTGREYRETYLLPLAQSSALKDVIKLESRVLLIGRSGWRKTDPLELKRTLPPFRMLVRDARGAERFEAADVILDCTGTFARPNWVGDGGIPAAGEGAARPQISYWPEDIQNTRRAIFAGKSVAVIGSGYSAATAICDLATLAEKEQATWIIWLTNGPKSQPLPRVAADPLKERDRLAAKANSLACRCDGNLEYHPQTLVDEVFSHGPDQGFRVTARVAGKPMTWEVERVIANVGYRPDISACSELRIAEPAGSIETDEPGYFMLGSKAMGRSSEFLIRDGHTQIRRAFAIVCGKPGLDLFRKAA